MELTVDLRGTRVTDAGVASLELPDSLSQLTVHLYHKQETDAGQAWL